MDLVTDEWVEMECGICRDEGRPPFVSRSLEEARRHLHQHVDWLTSEELQGIARSRGWG